jgi:BTB/POZ domain-containing protein KCTD9
MLGSRLSYHESYELLQQIKYCSAGAVPPIPGRRPQSNDEESGGVRFFRTFLENGNLENLTLPRTYISMSKVQTVSFANSYLHESVLWWSGFNNVNFTDADLSECDLCASIFRECSFVRANLRKADFRHSGFKECDFTDADMDGAKLTRGQGERIQLSDRQRQVIFWRNSHGEQPPGG